ncbi:hypothetical protein COW36_06560 [bacterium (Candidatus Blackallbacteria) CG17_big_fil_post_rev_8_21_14_2_50_48_46]|uniref:Cyanophage baseplate Pam3 plug gp18 domain-containing protein n=1 Tax=bacterium (Candidatus Blackallbacteria) CG17_big_fil_post_rev_8_21_14_2_50_48_46 TaxID=2014261 RepID=A0A2M7G7E2_9BACT|nr:MAG: hypothetical protein COW64_22955 [bacterium (Candidatus Blackallbacteria) CG18_big_fil_WC_8_21_14_2_50_49_26]PIW17999.1 MAG: hypothetical protein COW36_06560 [bacterium (Candidatus Blackallbacteria) CG17_big_fil_post_rev_8_21_14_2_50_48_46]PIW49644.1 MAG: hypothetical protein COW20_05280 [bacterium (Candidatus Blackallbacteria) CG13_big_fil_rev_8_21_14_2_50_49_14]
MAKFIIPIENTNGIPFGLGPITLSGNTFYIDFGWNDRLAPNGWYLHFYDSALSPIAHGINAVTNYSLLSHITDVRKPPGRLYLWDTSGKKLPPTASDLGTRVQLVYDDLIPVA